MKKEITAIIIFCVISAAIIGLVYWYLVDRLLPTCPVCHPGDYCAIGYPCVNPPTVWQRIGEFSLFGLGAGIIVSMTWRFLRSALIARKSK